MARSTQEKVYLKSSCSEEGFWAPFKLYFLFNAQTGLLPASFIFTYVACSEITLWKNVRLRKGIQWGFLPFVFFYLQTNLDRYIQEPGESWSKSHKGPPLFLGQNPGESFSLNFRVFSLPLKNWSILWSKWESLWILMEVSTDLIASAEQNFNFGGPLGRAFSILCQGRKVFINLPATQAEDSSFKMAPGSVILCWETTSVVMGEELLADAPPTEPLL